MKDFKAEKIRQKKKVITAALKRCLDKQVYSRITIQEIADEAGFSKGGLLHYFATKEDIYLTLIKEIFSEIIQAHDFIPMGFGKKSQTSITALVGAERFILDKNNVKIIMNLILYSFEEPKIKKKILRYLRVHRYFYLQLIRKNSMKEGILVDSEKDINHRAVIAQTIVLFIGLLDAIDPQEIDYIEIVKFVTFLLGA